jgi:hypothetical protein
MIQDAKTININVHVPEKDRTLQDRDSNKYEGFK